jgi:hypothetical protein
MGMIDTTVPMATTAITPPAEPVEQPDPPNEAKLEPKNAPNEANSHVHAPSGDYGDAGKGVRIDAPHVERKPVGGGITGKTKSHPALERALGGRNSNLMNLSAIFDR